MKHLNDWKIVNADASESAKKGISEVGGITRIGSYRPPAWEKPFGRFGIVSNK